MQKCVKLFGFAESHLPSCFTNVSISEIDCQADLSEGADTYMLLYFEDTALELDQSILLKLL